MDEIWEKAVEIALDGQNDIASVRNLTLDGAVKCVHGRLPPPSIFEKFPNLQHLSIANTGVSSLEQFPRLHNLQKLILSDNRIANGLEFLVEAGLESLRDLDLSNNRIQGIDDLRPLAELSIVSLDLYECPVTRIKDYRARVFGLVKSLRYLDKVDVDGNERPESDDEEAEEDEEDEEEEEEEEDPGSGEIDGEDRPFRMTNGHSLGNDGVVDVDEDEESDADEEETETLRGLNGLHQQSNGFHVEAVGGEEEENEEDDEGIDDDDDDDEDEDVVEVHEIEDSDDVEDGVEDDDEDDNDDEEVDNDEGDVAEPESTGRITSTEGEIDAHEQGEGDGDDEDDIGETGEEELGVEEGGEYAEEDAEDEWQEEDDTGYLLQPVVQQVEEDAGGSDIDAGNEEDEELEEEVEDEEDDNDGEVQALPSSSSPSHKRKRDSEGDSNGGDGNDEVGKLSKSSKPNQ